MEPYPEDSDRKQGLAKVAEMGISFVPVVGSALQVAFTEAAGRRLADRRTTWFNDIAVKVHALEDRIGDFAQLTSDDAFMDALTTATQIADRTSRAEKLRALRNAVVNSVMPGAPDPDSQQLLFDLIDRFTPTHVRMLTLISDPAGWFERHGAGQPDAGTVPDSYHVEDAMPELAGRWDLITRYVAGLTSAGVIDKPSVRRVQGPYGVWVRDGADNVVGEHFAATPLGTEFLEFIADPGMG